MANISQVYLLNTPLEDDMKNTLYFASESAQQTYMQNNILRSYVNVSYQRDTSTFRCPAQIDTIRNCNYLMFQNTAYTNKWFYAFIKTMTYVNDDYTDVEFEIDPIQTFMFDIFIHPSFIEREHTNDDTAGNNTIPENLELGDYIKNSNTGMINIGSNTMWYAVGVSEILGTLSTEPASEVNGLPNGLFYIFTDNVSNLQSIAKIYDDAGKAEAIYTMFVFPKALLQVTQGDSISWAYNNTTWTYNGRTYNTSFNAYVPKTNSLVGTMAENVHVPVPTRIGMSYTPRNKKLLTYPYCFFNITNNAGTVVPYHYEDFTGQPSFNLEGVINAGCATKLYPTNYKNMTIFDGDLQDNSYDYGVTGGKFPTISWNSDSYTNWLTENAINIGVEVGATALATVGNIGMGNVIGGTASAIGGVTSVVSKFYQASLMPDQAKGNTNIGDLSYTKYKNKFTVVPLSIKPEYARICDDYFDLFGYATHRVKYPNTNHRQNWWYTKTIDANITGNVPNDYMNQIKEAYNNGITFWRNPSNFLDYSVSNGIV